MKILLNGEYIYKIAPWLTWGEVLYGFEKNLISSKDIVDYAFLKLAENSSEDELELASLSDSELYRVSDILKNLTPNGIDQDILQKSWLYLFISWIYDHRDNFSDPFQMIEELYSDFNYPEDIASCVRYMPLPDGEIGGSEYLCNNIKRVISLYRKTLEKVHENSS